MINDKGQGGTLIELPHFSSISAYALTIRLLIAIISTNLKWTVGVVLVAVSLNAHSGGIDSRGGHNDNTAGNYHFHQGPLDGQKFASKEEATAALSGDTGEDSPPDLPAAQLPPVPQGQIRIASWNIRIYSTGNRDDSELELIADRLQQFDLIAIQELRDEEVVQRTLAILALVERSIKRSSANLSAGLLRSATPFTTALIVSRRWTTVRSGRTPTTSSSASRSTRHSRQDNSTSHSSPSMSSSGIP